MKTYNILGIKIEYYPRNKRPTWKRNDSST